MYNALKVTFCLTRRPFNVTSPSGREEARGDRCATLTPKNKGNFGQSLTIKTKKQTGVAGQGEMTDYCQKSANKGDKHTIIKPVAV